MDLLPNMILKNRYRIIQLLGKGGMGAVYLAFDSSLEQQCAVKINFGLTEQATNQFLREARLLATLRHPNLPRVFDYFILDNNQYLVMDFVPGKDLGEILNEQGIQPVEKVLAWAKQLISALTYMHQQKPPVIHRDIKPANIKVTPKGEVMLVDFGIAKAVETSQSTLTGAKGYTPGYAPPEQYGTGRTGSYSDQFSLAATLYRLLTNENPAEAMQRILRQANLIPIHRFNPTVPQNMADAIERGLSIRPEERFASVDEFLKALEDPNYRYAPSAEKRAKADYLPTKTAVAPPQSTPAVQPKKTSPLIWMGVGVVGVLLLLGIAGGGYALLSGKLSFLSPTATASSVPVAKVEGTETPKPESTATATSQPTETKQPAKTQSPTFTSEPSSTATESLTPTPEASATVELSPVGGDGEIAFISNRGDGGVLQIWTMRVGMDTTGSLVPMDMTQITFNEGDKSYVSWSPDGRYLTYSAPGSAADGGLDIYKIDITDLSQPPVLVVDRRGDDTDASWSPDGTTIAFVNNGREDKIRQVYFVDPQGGNMRRISYDYEEYSPIWSPDGSALYFVINGSGHQIIYVRYKNDDYAEVKKFDRTSMFGRLGNVDGIAFSPDGNWIAYTEIVTSKKTDVCNVLFSSGGGETHRLTEKSEVDNQPTWSRDSQWVVFTSERDGNQEVYIMDITGLIQVNLSNSSSVDMYPSWRP